jgi:hypothetical protein
MVGENEQRLVAWSIADAAGQTPSFGDMEIESPSQQKLVVTLPYEGGKLRICFNDVRSFMTSWDGDPSPFLTRDEVLSRPSELLRVEGSRWLSSGSFYLDVESSILASTNRWQHFFVLCSERSLHVAARDDIETAWTPGVWGGSPGEWTFEAEA